MVEIGGDVDSEAVICGCVKIRELFEWRTTDYLTTAMEDLQRDHGRGMQA